MSALRDLTGKKFGRWCVLGRAPDKISEAGRRYTMWFCLCLCGERKEVAGENLKGKRATSCGCRRQEVITTHGKSNTKEYHVWEAIVARCCNPKDKRYPKYGGRGIKMARVWRNSFAEFFKFTGKIGKGMTVDRIDNGKGYFPSNVRIVSYRDNNRNTSVSYFWYVRGVKYGAAIDAAKALKVSETTIHRWCGLGKNNGKPNIARPDCSAVLKYPNKSQ